MEQLRIKEAAARLQLSEVSVRRRLKNGHLAGEKIQTPQGYEWRVCLEPPAEPEPEPIPVAGDVSREAEALRGTIAVLARELEGRNREVDRLLQLLSREREIVRATQLAIPATTTQNQLLGQAARSQWPAEEPEQRPIGWWSRLINRVAGA